MASSPSHDEDIPPPARFDGSREIAAVDFLQTPLPLAEFHPPTFSPSEDNIGPRIPLYALSSDSRRTRDDPSSLSFGHSSLYCMQKVQRHSSPPFSPVRRTTCYRAVELETCSANESEHNFSGKEFTASSDDMEYTVHDESLGEDIGNRPYPCQEECKTGSDGREYFTYDQPLPEETGSWIPVSVPPSGFVGQFDSGNYEGNFFPKECAWLESTFNKSSVGPDLTAWGIMIEVIAFLCGARKPKGRCWRGLRHDALLCSGDIDHLALSLSEQMEEDIKTMSVVLASEPPQWLPDSARPVCMQCSSRFYPITCSRHHCRFCGGIFCRYCTSQRTLLPVKFQEKGPQRVCDSCYERLASVQGILIEQVSNAAQLATHDVTDLSCLRSWLNSPLGLTLEHEIYKATNTLRNFLQVGKLKPEQGIPHTIFKGAKGFAIFTVLKVGMMVTYKMGTGLVIAKRPDGSWSGPSAIASCGIGWGPQAGGEITDFIVVLRNNTAVRAFCGKIHASFGVGLSVAAGPIGRSFEADLRTGDVGTAACFTYSMSKGAFVGCSLEGGIVMTRSAANVRFYGDSSIHAAEILLGSIKPPKAAAPLYAALSDFSRSIV